ncbi:MAG TPA: PP2C family protein-serine/threonine phosphatase [Nocardioides sp.]|nr:PP2C family protein-serine/threonine phosphatase [Nocardioides sp.]
MDEHILRGLRDRLQELCAVPPLPAEWYCVSATLAAEGFRFGGDFFVADLVELPSGPALQMVLVDVCGKGDTALPDAVQLAGALGALLPVVPPDEMMSAANLFLLRQPSDEATATAAQVVVELATGGYVIRSAGHPPVLRWDAGATEWHVDTARGTALGVVDEPALEHSEGVLAPGEALLFYTDGVVESREQDIEDGIAWLQQAARSAFLADVATAPPRILSEVPRGDDDRAVLIIGRR